MKQIVTIDKHSGTPKYKQIIASVNLAIINGELMLGDRIPSINQLCKGFGLSQDTVLMAYNELKTRGIVSSAVGKGYYVASTHVFNEHKIFVLFDKFTAYKELLYDSMQNALGKQGVLDIFFHHSNTKVFQTLVNDAIGKYTAYVIMPPEQENCLDLISRISPKQLYLLDRGRAFCSTRYSGVFQNFYSDTKKALLQGLNLLKKYRRINVVSRDHRVHLREIITAVKDFCRDNGFEYRHLKSTDKGKIISGDAFLVINDADLVSLVQSIEKMKLKLAKDIGLISYNDTPLKKITAGGITTITTDFKTMGVQVIEMILQKKYGAKDNPSTLVIRNSL